MKQIMDGKMVVGCAPMEDMQCPHCGKVLHQIVHRTDTLICYTPYFDECDCPGAVKQREQEAADKATREQQEQAARHREKVDRLLADSGIHGRYADRALDTYTVPPGDLKALKVALNYVKKFDEQRKKGMGLFLFGKNGLGKTHLAYGVARALIEQERRVICRSATDIMLDFRGQMDGAASGTEYETMRRYQTCDLLVIDDLGKQQVTDWSLAQLFTILDGRYQDMRPVIVTTNYTDAALI
ncbi:MAG: ATP-binding protein, partial [Ethanoligenens sp.]